jgi:hypothetical protein
MNPLFLFSKANVAADASMPQLTRKNVVADAAASTMEKLENKTDMRRNLEFSLSNLQGRH